MRTVVRYIFLCGLPIAVIAILAITAWMDTDKRDAPTSIARTYSGSIAFATPANAKALPPKTVRQIAIDGAGITPAFLDRITTPTGDWPVHDLGAVADGRAYLFEKADSPDWWSVCIVRWATSKRVLNEAVHTVSVDDKVYRLSVLQGSMRCADNGEPVKPDMARLKAAVEAGRVVPYGAAAFSGFSVKPSFGGRSGGDYDPARIYGRSSSDNLIGVISGQGGEYDSSRGFLAERDALMITAALSGNNSLFNTTARRVRNQMLYGLSLPNLVIWSKNHHMLRDPQQPFPGDTPYVNEGIDLENYGGSMQWTVPDKHPYASDIEARPGQSFEHSRDIAHLFNHGYAYWLATGDPRAAILQQAIGAYGLAGTWQGGYGDGRYRSQFNYQRMMLNPFSALWKARDVAANITTENGKMFWPKARVDKMVDDIYSDWRTKIAAMDASRDPKKKMMAAFKAYDESESYSKFMGQAYGPEAAYLFASIGKGGLLTRLAQNMVLRVNHVGGARGVDGVPDRSTLIKMDGSATTKQAIVAKLLANTALPTDSFDGAELHYVIRAYWLLRMAQDAVARGWIAPIDGLDSAISKFETARSKTRRWKWSDITSWKHASLPF